MPFDLFASALMTFVKSTLFRQTVVPGVVANLATDLVKGVIAGYAGVASVESELAALERALLKATQTMFSMGLPERLERARERMEESLNDHQRAASLIGIVLSLNVADPQARDWDALRVWFLQCGFVESDFPEGMDNSLAGFVAVVARELRVEADSIPSLKLKLQSSQLNGLYEALERYVRHVESAQGQAMHSYRKALSETAQRLPYISLPEDRGLGERLPVLTDVYVEQVSGPTGDQQADRDGRRGTKTLFQMVEDSDSHFVLQGEPGVGKSTALRALALRLLNGGAKDSKYVPVVVTARRLVEHRGALLNTLLEEVQADLGIDLPPEFFQLPPHKGQWLILLDGIDEIMIPERYKSLNDQVLRVSRLYPWFRFVIASRPLAAGDPWLDPPLVNIRLCPLSDSQIASLANKWFSAAGNAYLSERFVAEVEGSPIKDLLRNPLLLTMTAILFGRSSDKVLPRNRLELYERFTEILMLDEETERKTWEPIISDFGARHVLGGTELARVLIENRRVLLEQAALKRQEGSTGSFLDFVLDYAILRGWLPSHIADDRTWLKSQIGRLLSRTGLLTRRGRDFEFIHQTFLEYLAACAAAQLATSDPRCLAYLEHWPEPRWREFLLLLLLAWSKRGNDVTRLIQTVCATSVEGLCFAGRAIVAGARVRVDCRETIIGRLLAHAKSTASYSEFREIGEVLARVQNDPRVLPGVYDLTLDDTLTVYQRFNAAVLIGKMGERRQAAKILLALAKEIGVQIPSLAQAYMFGATEAIERLKELGLHSSSSPWLSFRAAVVLKELGGSDEARAVFSALVRGGDTDTEVRRLAALQLATWEPDTAAVHLAMIARSPGIPVASRIEAATTLYNLGKSCEANRVLREMILEIAPHVDVTKVVAAVARRGDQQWIPRLKEWASNCKEFPQFLQFAIVMHELNCDGAVELLERSVIHPSWLERLCVLGSRHGLRPSYTVYQALAASLSGPSDRVTVSGLMVAGWLYAMTGQHREAARCFEVVSADDAIALVPLGLSLVELGETKSAIDTWERYLKETRRIRLRTAKWMNEVDDEDEDSFTPVLKRVRHYIADAEMSAGNLEKAVALYDIALSGGLTVAALVGKGLALWCMGDTSEAKRYFSLCHRVEDDCEFLSEAEEQELYALADLLLVDANRAIQHARQARLHRCPGETLGASGKWLMLRRSNYAPKNLALVLQTLQGTDDR